MKEFLKFIFSITNEHVHKVICILGIKIKFKLRYKVECDRVKAILQQEIYRIEKSVKLELNQKITDKENNLINKLIRTRRKTFLEQFEIHLTEHCNLNCKSCTHWSPLAQESYISVEDFTKDMKRMSFLTTRGGGGGWK